MNCGPALRFSVLPQEVGWQSRAVLRARACIGELLVQLTDYLAGAPQPFGWVLLQKLRNYRCQPAWDGGDGGQQRRLFAQYPHRCRDTGLRSEWADPCE